MAWFVILVNLCARIFLVLILFSVLCRTAIIRETINTLHEKVGSKVKLVLFFSFFGGLFSSFTNQSPCAIILFGMNASVLASLPVVLGSQCC